MHGFLPSVCLDKSSLHKDRSFEVFEKIEVFEKRGLKNNATPISSGRRPGTGLLLCFSHVPNAKEPGLIIVGLRCL